MKTRTLRALKASINHWRRLATGKRQLNEVTGPEHCALCACFLHPTKIGGDWCDGCPVQERTGRDCCAGTPYGKAERVSKEHGFDSAQFKTAAKEELAFLQSLLPK